MRTKYEKIKKKNYRRNFMVIKNNRVYGNIEDDKHDENEDVIEENNNLYLARLLFLHRQVG